MTSENFARRIFFPIWIVLSFAWGLTATPDKLSEARTFDTSILMGGTIVLAIPSKDGLIVAADSRVQIGRGTYCDNQYKIIEPARPDRTVIVVTGESMSVAPPPSGIQALCAYWRQAPRLFDIGVLVKGYVEAMLPTLEKMEIEPLERSCVEAILAYSKSYGGTPRDLWGRTMFTVMVAGHDSNEGTSIIRAFSVDLGVSGEPIIGQRGVRQARRNDPPQPALFGERDFVREQVLGGVGRQFLRGPYAELGRKRTVAEVNFELARDAATDLIEAAARTAEFIRYDGGIGGPVDVVLLGNGPRPQRLRWKPPS